jgi:hypothetical protein
LIFCPFLSQQTRRSSKFREDQVTECKADVVSLIFLFECQNQLSHPIKHLASGYNSMLATNESPCTSASTALMIDASNGEHQAPPRLQVLTNGMAGMQLAANEFKQQMVQGPGRYI